MTQNQEQISAATLESFDFSLNSHFNMVSLFFSLLAQSTRMAIALLYSEFITSVLNDVSLFLGRILAN